MTPTTARGACLCGAVRFRCRLPSRWVAHCHCSMCRRAHGAAFVTWVGVDADGFEVEDPAALRWHRSSADAERGFCAHCGSSLLFRSARWPGEMHVARANLDDPLDRVPQLHAFWATHVDWARVDDGLPTRD